jgi:hypothetical protein
VHVQRHTGTTKTSLSLQEICLLSSAFFHAHGRCFSFNGRVEPTEVKLSSIDLTWPMEEPTLNPNRNPAPYPTVNPVARLENQISRNRSPLPPPTAHHHRLQVKVASGQGGARRSMSSVLLAAPCRHLELGLPWAAGRCPAGLVHALPITPPSPLGWAHRLMTGLVASAPARLHGHHCAHRQTCSRPQLVLPGKRCHRARIRYPPPPPQPWQFTVR